jgi:hypothetical protein
VPPLFVGGEMIGPYPFYSSVGSMPYLGISRKGQVAYFSKSLRLPSRAGGAHPL